MMKNNTKILRPGEMARLGKLDVSLRKAQKLIKEAYEIVLEAKREYGCGLEFNAVIGWDRQTNNLLRTTYEAECSFNDKDVNPYHLSHLDEFGLASGCDISLNGSCSMQN